MILNVHVHALPDIGMSLEHKLSSLLHMLGQAHLSLSQHLSQSREDQDFILENIKQMLPYRYYHPLTVMTRPNFISHQLAGFNEGGDAVQGLLLRYYKHPVIIILYKSKYYGVQCPASSTE